jgi:hypothetical protein
MTRFVNNKPRLRRHREYWYKRIKFRSYGRTSRFWLLAAAEKRFQQDTKLARFIEVTV